MRIIILLLFVLISSVISGGCARNEAELQDGITKTFEYVFLPAQVFTRQIDNGLDTAVNLEKRDKK